MRSMLLYEGRCDFPGVEVSWRERASRLPRNAKRIVSENVVKSVIDTARSMIASNRPKATFVTDGGNFSTQRRAKLLGKFTEALAHQVGIYETAPLIFRDACIFGFGAVKVFEDDGKVAVERVIPDEIVVDENECRAAPPRQIHQRKFVDKNVLKGMFPDKADLIEEAHREDPYWTSYRRIANRQVVVIESWHLPSGEKGDKGRHQISVETGVLLREDYDEDCFPFVFYRWNPAVTGFSGPGLASELMGHQAEINRKNRFVDAAMERIAVPRIYVSPADAKIRVQLDNKIGNICVVKQKPIFETPGAIHPEVFNRLEQIKTSAFQFAGISQLSAQAKKPGGLESAVALREYNDIETNRFSIQAQAYEQFFLEVFRKMVRVAAEIGDGLAVTWNARDLARRIDWSEVELDADTYSMGIEASSIISRTPAGRLQAVIELLQGGLIGPDEGRRLLGHPDLERETDLANAAIEDIEWTIEQLEDEGAEFPTPEPAQALELGLKRVQQNLLRCRALKAPEEVLQRHRDWLELAEFTLNPPPSPEEQMAAMAAPPMPGMPPAGPMDPNQPQAQPVASLAPEAMKLQPTQWG